MKSIILQDDVHALLKTFCDDKNFKINRFVNNIIVSYINGEKSNVLDLRAGNERSNERIPSEEKT